MSEYEFECNICQSKFIVHTYGDFKCETCGQEYEYNEGHSIVLSKEQLELLQKQRKS